MGVGEKTRPQSLMAITCRPFGNTRDGTAVDLYTLTAERIVAEVITYGGRLRSMRVADRGGELSDVTVGFDRLADYLQDKHYCGGVVGRYANRIKDGAFSIGSRRFQLSRNSGPDHLHGGFRGFDEVVWRADVDGDRLTLTYVSRDGEEGYPGNLTVTATYSLTAANELRLDFLATSDCDTIVNLAHHPYFNLAGGTDLAHHTFRIFGAAFLPVDNRLLPTGERLGVSGTAMDLRMPSGIDARLESRDSHLLQAGGFDHTWILDEGDGILAPGAEVAESASGRCMTVLTSQPGLHFYSANAFDAVVGRGGRVYRRQSCFALEAQHFADSPNRPEFPSTVLTPDRQFRQTTIYRFSLC
jgi:aldose 1-epimerase